MMTAQLRKKWAKKDGWEPVSARVSPEIRNKLREKHPNDGEVSRVIRALIQKYLEGKIYGLSIPAE